MAGATRSKRRALQHWLLVWWEKSIKGNNVFDFWKGFPVKNLKTMNHLNSLTMVSMETRAETIIPNYR